MPPATSPMAAPTTAPMIVPFLSESRFWMRATSVNANQRSAPLTSSTSESALSSTNCPAVSVPEPFCT